MVQRISNPNCASLGAPRPTVLLTTYENGGSKRSGGLEFTLSGKLTPKLSVNTSGNLAVTEQQQVDLYGLGTKRTASSLSLRGDDGAW
jgi:hypothetical protein